MSRETIRYRPGLRDGHEELLPQFQMLLVEAAQPTSWCLDLGCGEGRVTFELAPMVRWVVGIDRSPERITSARERARRLSVTNAKFLVADAESIRYGDLAPVGRFQLIASNLCLTDQIINAVPEALAPGGRFIVACFETRQWQETGMVNDHAYDEDRLLGVLSAAGLEAEELKTVVMKVEFDSIEQLREDYLPQRLIKRWENDGRWENLERSFAAGTRTLTYSKIVFSARLKTPE